MRVKNLLCFLAVGAGAYYLVKGGALKLAGLADDDFGGDSWSGGGGGDDMIVEPSNAPQQYVDANAYWQQQQQQQQQSFQTTWMTQQLQTWQQQYPALIPF